MTVIKKCITVTPEQDEKIKRIQVRRMVAEKTNVSYSKVIQSAITEGLERMQ